MKKPWKIRPEDINLVHWNAALWDILKSMMVTIFSVVFLKEDLTLVPFIGMLLSLESVFLLSRSEE